MHCSKNVILSYYKWFTSQCLFNRSKLIKRTFVSGYHITFGETYSLLASFSESTSSDILRIVNKKHKD